MFRKFISVFLGAESVEEMRKKGLTLSLAVPVIRWMDWVLMGATASFVGFLKFHAVPEWVIFLILWILNMVLSASVIFAAVKTGTDLTLMEGLRRLVDAVIGKSKTAGLMLEAVVIGRLLLWDGADQFIVFLKRRIVGVPARVAAFILVSGFQMAVWTVLYGAGYDSLSRLFFH